MKEVWQKAFWGKDKKERQGMLFTLFCVGILLFLVNQFFADSTNIKVEETTVAEETSAQKAEEAALEERLEAVFSQVEGAGRVEVMVYFQTDGELVVAEEESSQTRGSDTEKTTQKVILEKDGGGQTPLVVQQKAPQVEGVLIVAQGGQNVQVQQALISGAQALLGVPAHKIAVFPMETAQ